MHGNQAYTLRDRYDADMGSIQNTVRGTNVKSLVANDEREFNILTFQTY